MMRGTHGFTDPQELQILIDAYFKGLTRVRKFTGKGDDGKPIEWEEEYTLPPTMAGLALALDTTRRTLLAYGKGEGTRGDKFTPVIARAKERLAEFAETALFNREASNGAKFALEVNHRYGREDEDGGGGTGDGFEMKVISPAATEGDQLAIPKWEPKEDE
jgi:hypothetical protein